MKKVLSVFAAFILFIGVLFSPAAPVSAGAAEETAFEHSDVLEDLQSVKEFSLAKYPFYESAKPEMHLINVVEYCYSFRANERENYGLYLYLYNPNALEIDVDSYANRVQLAVAYDTDPVTAASVPTGYEKFALKLCSVSSGNGTSRLFYKFKVVDHRSADGKTVAERVNSAARRYDISGVELVTKGESTAHEYPITGNFSLLKSDTGYGTYTFTGFAKGYGADPNEESTLSCSVNKLETVQLDVKHTFYRTKTSSKGLHHQNQIDTVYFSVPKRLFDNYGKLQRIKAEWYEYVTKMMLVTNNKDYYDFISQYIGSRAENVPDDKYIIIPYLRSDLDFHNPLDSGAKYGWNVYEGWLVDGVIDPLYYIFHPENWGDISEYDPYSERAEGEGGVSSNRLYEYIKQYSRTAESGYLPIKDGQISADLFEDDIQEDRKAENERGKVQKGYSYFDFDADLDLLSWSAWTKPEQFSIFSGCWNNYWGDIPDEEGAIGVMPIQVIKPGAEELQLDRAALSDKLYINYADVPAFQEECEDAFTVDGPGDEEKYVVVFRFAVTDYYSEEAVLAEWKDNWWDEYIEGQAYLAQETCFFDFDIIQLSFQKDEKWTVIAAVSDPIDIVNAITTPSYFDKDEMPWWAWVIIAVVALVVLLLFGMPILKFLLQVVIFIVTAPFKLIQGIIRRFRE